MRLVYCGTGWLEVVDAIRAGLPAGAEVRIRDPARPILEELRGADVVLPSHLPLDASALAALPGLRLIQQPAVGVEGIELAAARARGIPVCNVPHANADAVAEAALLLILALSRRLPEARRALAAARLGTPIGRELRGQVLGVVGLGRSGGRLAEIARALGMVVVSVTSRSGPAALAALLERADVVSVHCPLTPATRHLLDGAALARLKPGALLVNCARAAIVERAALERALASGRLGGVGLDTCWSEPWDPADPLLARDDVVALPHVAGATREAYARIADVIGENVRRLARGAPLLHRIG